LPLPECRHSPMNFPAQLAGGAASAGAMEASSSEESYPAAFGAESQSSTKVTFVG
jgi:hypothetical protein